MSIVNQKSIKNQLNWILKIQKIRRLEWINNRQHFRPPTGIIRPASTHHRRRRRRRRPWNTAPATPIELAIPPPITMSQSPTSSTPPPPLPPLPLTLISTPQTRPPPPPPPPLPLPSATLRTLIYFHRWPAKSQNITNSLETNSIPFHFGDYFWLSTSFICAVHSDRFGSLAFLHFLVISNQVRLWNFKHETLENVVHVFHFHFRFGVRHRFHCSSCFPHWSILSRVRHLVTYAILLKKKYI